MPIHPRLLRRKLEVARRHRAHPLGAVLADFAATTEAFERLAKLQPSGLIAQFAVSCRLMLDGLVGLDRRGTAPSAEQSHLIATIERFSHDLRDLL